MDNVDLRLECYRMALDAGFELGDVRAEAQRIYDWAVGVKTGMKSDIDLDEIRKKAADRCQPDGRRGGIAGVQLNAGWPVSDFDGLSMQSRHGDRA